MTPSFLVIGAAKAGTTTLCELLGRHPQIYMFPHKETHFFSEYYHRGFEWYKAKFTPTGPVTAIGEGSPTYAEGRSEVVERIHKHLPDARLIYIVRHPITRIESEYVQLLDNGLKFSSLDDALKNWLPLVGNSCYLSRINEFRKFYDDDQILVLFLDDLEHAPEMVLEKCFCFLEVNPAAEIDKSVPTLNTRASKQRHSRFWAWIREQKFFLDLKFLLPASVTRRLKPLLRRPIAVDIEWEDAARQSVTAKLKAEIPKFLHRYGKPPDYWTLD